MKIGDKVEFRTTSNGVMLAWSGRITARRGKKTFYVLFDDHNGGGWYGESELVEIPSNV